MDQEVDQNKLETKFCLNLEEKPKSSSMVLVILMTFVHDSKYDYWLRICCMIKNFGEIFS